MDGKPPTVDSMDKNNKFSKAFKNFVSKCLIKDPQKRLSAQELLSSEFIKKHTKDRQFIIDNFVKHIKTIQIKQCNEYDLPSSIQDGNRKLLKKKSTRYQVTVDTVNNEEVVDGDGGKEDDDDDDDEVEFNYSTSIRDEDIENLKNDINHQGQDENNNQNNNDNTNKNGGSRFKVTTEKQQSPKKKSRFQVT